MNTDAADRREEGFAQIVSEVHGHVDFTPPEQTVRALCSSVPIELLTYIMGQSESTVHRWASGDVTDMSRESERRLAAAYEILQLIDRFGAPGVAATWFTCDESQLDFVMPATALRVGLLQETLAAARHFVAVGWRMFMVVASNLRATGSERPACTGTPMIDVSGIAPEARPIVKQAAAIYIKHTAPWFVGLIVLGSALRGDFIPGCSDIDLQIYLDASAFEPGDRGRLPLDLCIAIQRDLAKVHLGPFSYIQGHAFSTSFREGWVGPVPGTYRLVSGRLPTAEATPEQLRRGVAARLSALEPVPEHLTSGLLDYGEHGLQRQVRLLITEVWPALKQVLVLQRDDPVGVWSLTKRQAIDLLPEDSPMGGAIRDFYAAIHAYYPTQESVEAALAVIEHGVAFLQAAKAWWQGQDHEYRLTP